MTTTQAKLDERYGRSTSRRRRILGWVIVAVLALTATALLSWSTIAQAIDSVEADDTGYLVNDAHSVTITFQLTMPADRAIACAIEAQDEDHGTVGWRVVEYRANGERVRAFTETIPTSALSTTGFVNHCWIP